ncbi:MAG: electron transport complex subunit RsxD [Gammaproteobacteria bacterium]|nr:electron transport complex subunit RsxD [Gammaproteobacteria bacterium]
MSRRFETASSPHIKPKTSVTKVMGQVLLALVPGIAIYTGLFGWGVITNIVIACVTGLAFEMAMLQLRGKPFKPFLKDLSAVVTAVLLAVAIPPGSPWWLITVGMLFAIVVAKQLYGGLGYNPFNPAMIGYVVLLLCFPVEMTQWQAPLADVAENCRSLAHTFTTVFSAGNCNVDGYTAATVLDAARTAVSQESSVLNAASGFVASAGYEWVAIAWAVGGVFLMWRGIIGWHIPVGMIAALLIVATAGWAIAPERLLNPITHLIGGATLLGAFFIATDPVSACTTVKGRVIYGALIGVLVYVIRSWGGYPDAVAFAVLLANLSAPMIDYYSKPKVFGYQ